MADSYDEQGNYIFPEGFDSETNEWLDGFDKQREAWEGRYAEAERRHKMHTTQMEKFAAAAEAAANAPTDYSSDSADKGGDDAATASSTSSSSSSAPKSGGSLASDEQLAALREKLSGNA
jgi:small subunit ribosomal protein S1